MARYDMWLAMQRQLVDNGTAAATIVLEGPDGGRFGTWPIAFPNLEESITGMLQSLTEALPKGRHACRLVSFDSQAAQLSALPITVAGAGEAATEAGQGRLNQERSNSITISNAEKQINAAMVVVDHLSKILESSMAAHEKKDVLIDELIETTRDTNRDLIRAQGREERLNNMFKSLEPLVGVAANFAATFAVDWLEKKGMTSKEPPEQIAPQPPPPPPPPPPPANAPQTANASPETPESKEPISQQGLTVAAPFGNVTTSQVSRVAESADDAKGPTTSDQSTGSRDPRSDPSSGESRADVERRAQGNGGNDPRRDRSTRQNSKLPSATGRRSELAEDTRQSRKARKKS